MEIYLKQGHTFPVPVTVADNLLKLASHDQLKVLLYLLCHAEEPLSAETVAQNCKVLPDAVEEAIAFWQDANVLSNTQDLPAVRLQNTAPQQRPAPVLPPPGPGRQTPHRWEVICPHPPRGLARREQPADSPLSARTG